MKKILILVIICLGSFGIYATPTTVIVRAKSKDAKFIGSSMGGALVIIREKATGEILAKGKTVGSTGNTNLIMNTPSERYKPIAVDDTAKFTAELDLDEPIFVRIEVFAPFNKKQATVAASTEVWLIPGKNIVGDGIVLEIPGFVVDILNPRTHQYIPLNSLENGEIEIKTNVVMMCGCPISSGGLWDADKMEVKAIIKMDGKALTEVELRPTETSLFKGNYKIESAGVFEVVVYAFSPLSGNTGVDKINFIITN